MVNGHNRSYRSSTHFVRLKACLLAGHRIFRCFALMPWARTSVADFTYCSNGPCGVLTDPQISADPIRNDHAFCKISEAGRRQVHRLGLSKDAGKRKLYPMLSDTEECCVVRAEHKSASVCVITTVDSQPDRYASRDRKSPTVTSQFSDSLPQAQVR